MVGRCLIIHEDGSYTIWSASVTSPEEVQKAKKIESEEKKEKYVKELGAVQNMHESIHLFASLSTHLPYVESLPATGRVSTDD